MAKAVLKPVGWITASNISWMESKSSTIRTEDVGAQTFRRDGGKSTQCLVRLLQATGNRTQLEDREEHRHDDAADHHAEEDDEDGLDQRSE